MKTTHMKMAKRVLLLLLCNILFVHYIFGQDVAEYIYYPKSVGSVAGYDVFMLSITAKETNVFIAYSKSTAKNKYGLKSNPTLIDRYTGKKYIAESVTNTSDNRSVVILLTFAPIHPSSTGISLECTNFQGTQINIPNVVLQNPTKKGVLPIPVEQVEKKEIASSSSFSSSFKSKEIVQPYVRQISNSHCTLDKVVKGLVATVVYITFNGTANLFCSSDYYIKDCKTGKTYPFVSANGIAMDPKRTWVGNGETLSYSLVFKPIPEDTELINIIEPVSGGFNFLGVNLKDDVPNMNLAAAKTCQPIKKLYYSDRTRKFTISNFDSDYQFSDGMLAIYSRSAGHWGFINEQGELVIPYKWDYEYAFKPRFGGGYCTVAKTEEGTLGLKRQSWYVLDKKGNAVKIPGNVVKASRFVDGYATVLKRIGQTNSYRYTYINGKGMEVFPALARTIYESYHSPEPHPFKDDRALFYDVSKRKYGFINRAGRIVIPAIYLNAQDFSEGLAAVEIDTEGSESRWGFIDVNGVMKIPAKFSKEPLPFSEGYAPVTKRNGRMVMIDKSGEVVSGEYRNLSQFHGGYAFIHYTDRPVHEGAFVINKSFRVVKGPVKYFEVPKEPIVFHNNVCMRKGSSTPYDLFTNTGERFVQEYGWKYKTISENLFYIDSKNVEGFANYQGEIVFTFEPEEF